MEKEKIIYIGSDHAGFPMKDFVRRNLEEAGYKVKDFGTDSEESVDYPDYIHPIAKAINDGEDAVGVIFCGSGNGAQMTANKYTHIRAALCWNKEQAFLARLHNDANIISVPGRFVDFSEAWEMVKIFLETEFEGGRHERRVKKISERLN